MPTFIGMSISPTRSPPAFLLQRVRPRYLPSRAAYAWAAASMARKSLPVAIATASTPFMMPLLWVAARYGSTSARSLARMMPSRTSASEYPRTSRFCAGMRTDARTSARSVRLDRMRRNTLPPVTASTRPATPSHMPFTRFAPMASWVSTNRCSTTISRPSSGAVCWNTSMSRAPPPRATMFGCSLLARSRISSLCALSELIAASASRTSTTCTWPIRIGSVVVA